MGRRARAATIKPLFTLPCPCEAFRIATLLDCAEHKTTNLGVRSSNLFGRASFLHFPCDSHGIHTETTRVWNHTNKVADVHQSTGFCRFQK